MQQGPYALAFILIEILAFKGSSFSLRHPASNSSNAHQRAERTLSCSFANRELSSFAFFLKDLVEETLSESAAHESPLVA